jgi:hypothetical protein
MGGRGTEMGLCWVVLAMEALVAPGFQILYQGGGKGTRFAY